MRDDDADDLLRERERERERFVFVSAQKSAPQLGGARANSSGQWLLCCHSLSLSSNWTVADFCAARDFLTKDKEE